MPDVNLNRADPLVLYQTMMGMIYDTLTGGDSEVLKDKDYFFTWQSVGIPVDPAEWDFMSGKLTSPSALEIHKEEPEPVDPEAAKPAVTETSTTTPTNADTSTDSVGDRMRFFLHNAEMFARQVDFIPDVSGRLDMEKEQKVLHTASLGHTITGEYKRVLDECILARDVISADAKAQIKRLTDFLVVSAEIKDDDGNTINDPVTGEPMVISQPSRFVKAYDQYMADYHLAWGNLNNIRVSARESDDAGAVVRASVQLPIEQQKVHAARQLWETAGFRSQVESWRAELERLAANSMTAYWSELKTNLETSEQEGIWTTGKWHWAQVTTPNILRSDGWMRFSMTDTHVNRTSSSSSKTTSGGFTLPIPQTPVVVGGELESGESSGDSSYDLSDFSISFDLAEVPLSRPCVDINFLLNDRWKLPTGADPLSDGGSPPRGSLVAIPTFIILVRNLTLRFKELGDVNSRMSKHLDAEGGLSMFGFNLGLKAARGTSEASNSYDFNEKKGEITVKGAQIVGFRNQIMPQAPNPDPLIQEWVAAGGQT